jgi:hypothetical protein
MKKETLPEWSPIVKIEMLEDIIEPKLVQQEMCDVAGDESYLGRGQRVNATEGGMSIQKSLMSGTVRCARYGVEMAFLAPLTTDGPHVRSRMPQQERASMLLQQASRDSGEITSSKHLLGQSQMHSWCGHCVAHCTSSRRS